MFESNEAVRGRLIGPNLGTELIQFLNQKLEQPCVGTGCLGTVCVILRIRCLFGMH